MDLLFFAKLAKPSTQYKFYSGKIRVGIATRCFWQRCEKVLFDVKLGFQPLHLDTSTSNSQYSFFNANEREKKPQYNQQIIDVKYGSLIYTDRFCRLWWLQTRDTAYFLSFFAEKLTAKKNFELLVVLSWFKRQLCPTRSSSALHPRQS